VVAVADTKDQAVVAAAAAEAARQAEEARKKALADLQRHGQAMAAITKPQGGGRR
jgi:hypothetical protein